MGNQNVNWETEKEKHFHCTVLGLEKVGKIKKKNGNQKYFFPFPGFRFPYSVRQFRVL